MKLYRNIFILLLVLACCCACGEKKGDKGEQKPVGLDAEYKEIHEVTEIKDGRKNVYVILKAWGNTYWDGVLQGTIDGGNEADCNVYAGGVLEEENWERQEALIEQAAEMGADAIVLAPINAPSITETVSKIHGQGIPIVFVDTIIDTADFDTCYMTDNMSAGEMAAREMLEKLKKAGKTEDESLNIGVQTGSTSSQTIIDRVAGFMSYWTINAPENWKVIDDVKINNGNLELAEEQGRELISNYPDLAGIYSCNNGSTVGAVKSILNSGREDIVLVGFDYSEEMEQMLKSGKYLVSTVLQRQYNMGYLGVKAAANDLENELKFNDTGIMLINQDNVFNEDIVKELEASG